MSLFYNDKSKGINLIVSYQTYDLILIRDMRYELDLILVNDKSYQ